MKALRYGISGLLVAGFAFVAACGGSTDDGGDGTPGAGGKTSTGGRSGTGSTGGSSTGVPNNPAACPGSAPADASACTLSGVQSTCAYSGMSCSCVRAPGGGGFPGGTAGAGSTATRQWDCSATLICPATKPTVGDACTPASGTCRYSGMGSCNCSAQSSKWSCTGGTGPGGGSGGSFNGFGGGFSFGGFSSGTGGRPTTGGGGSCPATKPAVDSACTGDLSCPYTGGGCVCSADKWTCL